MSQPVVVSPPSGCPSAPVHDLPVAWSGVFYSVTASACCGAATVFSSQSALPPGLALSPQGVISGIPTSGGDYQFTVNLANALGCRSATTYRLHVSVCPQIDLDPVLLPAAVIGGNFQQTLKPTGGSPPYVLSLTGFLPPGLALTGTVISGTPIALGSFTFSIGVSDVNGCRGGTSYLITVTGTPRNCPPIVPGTNVFLRYVGENSGCDETHNRCLGSEHIHFRVANSGYDFSCSTHSFTWNFGDREIAVGASVTHAYGQPGAYTPSLVISNGQQSVVLETSLIVTAPRRRVSRK